MSQLNSSSQQRILLDLVISLQHALDVDTAVAHLLSTIVEDLQFPSAVVALVDHEQRALYPWISRDQSLRTAAVLHGRHVRLDQTDDPLVAGLLAGAVTQINLQEPFSTDRVLLMPLYWGERPIGLLLIELGGRDLQRDDEAILLAVSEQAAVSLGMMQTRHRRAKETAVQEERARLALDLHDTVSQSLFGLVSTLQACQSLLAENPQQVAGELAWALETAEEVRRTMRATVRNLWPAELTAERFEADLREYAATILQTAELEITFDIRGDFSALSPPVRRSMYRICQEALTNIVHHAGARQSRVCVDVSDGRAQFVIRDDGRGFDLHEIFSQTYSEDHFGLRGIQERAVALGGSCRIYSQPDAGASIVIDLPANGQDHHYRLLSHEW